MKVVYPVIFTQTKDDKDTYLVEIPDIGGLTQGQGLEDAFFMARDYIGNVLFNMHDEEIPPASDPVEIDIKKCSFSGEGKSFISLVDVDLEMFRRMIKSRSVRRNVSLPEYLDDAAKKAHLNVSSVLQEALMEKLGFVKKMA